MDRLFLEAIIWKQKKRLIDANEVERKIRIAISSWQRDCNANAPIIARAMEDALQRVIYAPTIDAVEVAHGRWKKYQISNMFTHTCSICNCDVNIKTAYCPNCGAKMDGKDNVQREVGGTNGQY